MFSLRVCVCVWWCVCVCVRVCVRVRVCVCCAVGCVCVCACICVCVTACAPAHSLAPAPQCACACICVCICVCVGSASVSCCFSGQGLFLSAPGGHQKVGALCAFHAAAPAAADQVDVGFFRNGQAPINVFSRRIRMHVVKDRCRHAGLVETLNRSVFVPGIFETFVRLTSDVTHDPPGEHTGGSR